MEQFIIRLNSLRFFSRIGVLEQERRVGNEFIVNVEVAITASSFIEEDLSTSISYAEIYEEVNKVMREEWLLLETVAVRIKDSLTARCEEIEGGKVTIEKLSPPIAGIEGSCGIEYVF